ncbi:MAG TPA: LysE family transporter [Clostridia bacterium]|jgi:threonine/homoserine/homoserine lactone efflux protein|nr:LysE family transporter [Clostridia bacterium]
MDLAALFTSSFIIALSGALVPGPLLAITAARVVEKGAGAGPLVVLGHAVSEMAVMAGIVFGLGYYLQLPPVASAIAVIGGCVLLWMGWGMIRDFRAAGSINVEVAAAGPRKFLSGPVVSGFIGSVSNPYWILWWATVGAALLASAMKQGSLGVGVFFTGHILADLVWYSLVAFSLAAGRRWFSEKLYQWLFLGCGIAMVFLAFYFIWSGTAGQNSLGGF